VKRLLVHGNFIGALSQNFSHIKQEQCPAMIQGKRRANLGSGKPASHPAHFAGLPESPRFQMRCRIRALGNLFRIISGKFCRVW
jgi:hypothetical protein